MLLQETSPAEAGAVEDALTHPVAVTYGAGFYNPEQDAESAWRWTQSTAQATLENPEPAARTMTFDARLFGGRSSNVTFMLDGRRVSTARATPRSRHPPEFTFTLPPGKHVLTMTSDAPPTTPAAGDPRDLTRPGHRRPDPRRAAAAALDRAPR